MKLTPRLGEDACFAYTNLKDEENVNGAKPRLSFRLKFNKKPKIIDSITANQTCVKHKGGHLFPVKNINRDPSDGKELGNGRTISKS